MKSRTIFISSVIIAVCLLSTMSVLMPTTFGATSSATYVSQGSLAGSGASSYPYITTQTVPSAHLPTYNVTLKANPKTFSIIEAPASDCGSYPVCGNGTTTFTVKDTGSSKFTLNGLCTLTVTPKPKGIKSLSCSGPTGSLKHGEKGTFTWTTTLYNWPSGTYTFHLKLDGTVSSTTYQSKTGTYVIKVTS